MKIEERPGNLVDMVCTGTFPQDWSLPLPNHQNVLSKISCDIFKEVFKALTFRPFGVSTPTSPYWIRLLWKPVTKLSRSPWVNQNV